MSGRWRERLSSPWLTSRTSFVLAAFFVVAGIAKIADPPQFAHEVHNYRLLPDAAVNLMAMLLPWVEVVAGVLLFLGIWRRETAALLGVLLIVFLGALSINLARGHPVDCGCFGSDPHAKAKTSEERLAEMKLAILRDAALLLLAAQAAASRRSESLSLAAGKRVG